MTRYYILTLDQGIQEIDQAKVTPVGGGRVRLQLPYCSRYVPGKSVHETLEGAIRQAEAMRQAKIKSLEKQLAKLKAMNFSNTKIISERSCQRPGEFSINARDESSE